MKLKVDTPVKWLIRLSSIIKSRFYRFLVKVEQQPRKTKEQFDGKWELIIIFKRDSECD